MNKKWLIRTKSNHILGPVSRNKLMSLLENKLLKEEDEICSGNGFWLFIREKELIQKYLYNDEKQPFNPVSEADNVLTPKEEFDFNEISQNLKLDIASESSSDEEDSFELSSEENLSTHESGAKSILLPVEDDLSYPEMEEGSPSSNSAPEPSQENLRKNKKKIDLIPEVKLKKSILNDKVLFSLLISLLLAAIFAFYFRKRIIETLIDGNASIVFIDSAHAETYLDSKKKS